VSGQISDLQDRSKQLDGKLKSRRVSPSARPLNNGSFTAFLVQKIERPLSSLITDICLPPSLITTILDTDVSDSWISSIGELEQHLDTLQARGRVKAAKDMVELMAQVQLVVCPPKHSLGKDSPHSPPKGHWKNTDLLRGHFKTNKIEHDDEHASNPDFGVSQIPAAVHFSPTARAKRSFGVPEVLHCSRESLL
jgi:hypothetical protein